MYQQDIDFFLISNFDMIFNIKSIAPHLTTVYPSHDYYRSFYGRLLNTGCNNYIVVYFLAVHNWTTAWLIFGQVPLYLLHTSNFNLFVQLLITKPSTYEKRAINNCAKNQTLKNLRITNISEADHI